VRKDAETEHGHADGLHQRKVEESALDTAQMENMWNGNNIRKHLKNPGFFFRNFTGQGMMKLKTLCPHFTFVGVEYWIVSDTSGLNRNSI